MRWIKIGNKTETAMEADALCMDGGKAPEDSTCGWQRCVHFFLRLDLISFLNFSNLITLT